MAATPLPKATEPFRFFSRVCLRELTGFRAITIAQLLRLLKHVPGSVIFHHTHHYLQQHQYLIPEAPNDFAYWVNNVFGEKTLGEQLASVSTTEFKTIRALRNQLIDTIERYIWAHPFIRIRFVAPEDAFHFIKVTSIVLETPHAAGDLLEFEQCLQAVTVESLYYHIFEAPLRLGRQTNDFSLWFRCCLGEDNLAGTLEQLDPYTHTMEDLRRTILRSVHQRILEIIKQ